MATSNPPTAAQPGSSAWAPLANPVFRALWIASLASNVGSWMEDVGAQWVLVAASAPALIIALVQTASLMPTVFFSLPAGVLADSMDRRRLLLAVSIGSLAVSIALTLATIAGVLTAPLVLFFTFLFGVAGALVGPAWQAIQPDLVPREQIPAAAALGGMSFNASRAIGPALAGALLSLSGPWLVFALDALSYAAVVVAIYRWQPERAPRPDPEGFVESLRAGIHYVVSAFLVRRILIRSALFALPASALWALLPLVAKRLGFESFGYGLLLATIGTGATGSIAVLPMLRRKLGDSSMISLGSLVFGIGTVVAAFAPAGVVIPVLVLVGASWTLALTVMNSAMQLTLATWVRARGLAIYVIIFMGCSAGGSAIAGALADRVGIATTLGVAGGLLILVAATGRLLPLLPGTSEIDRTVSLAWSAPRLQFEPAPTDGPVTVISTYTVSYDHTDEFVAAMRSLRLSRMRGGARRWRLYRDGQQSDRFVEIFDVPSWTVYRRQHLERLTRADEGALLSVWAIADEHSPEDQLFPAENGRRD